MEWQYPLALAMIVIAGVAVLWRFAKVVRSAWTGKGCGSGCGKCRPGESQADTGKIGLPMIRQD